MEGGYDPADARLPGTYAWQCGHQYVERPASPWRRMRIGVPQVGHGRPDRRYTAKPRAPLLRPPLCEATLADIIRLAAATTRSSSPSETRETGTNGFVPVAKSASDL